MTTTPISTVRLRAPDREGLEAHFLALGGEDRRLRFGSGITDEGLHAYVGRIDFAHDGVFAVQDDRLRIIAVVHVAIGARSAELGLSVRPGARGQGLGNALFGRAVTFLVNRGIRSVFVHCISENAAMMHLARKRGMRIAHSGSESDARLELPAATAGSYVAEWLDDQGARMVQALRQGVLPAKA